jgi:predicted nucleic acid-binding protein
VPDGQQALSVLARVEARSALARKLRLAEITASEADDFEVAFQSLYANKILWEIDEAVLSLAADLLSRNALRSLDALQLASVILFRSYLLSADNLLFIASDNRLLAAAAAESLPTWNPA